MFRVLVVEDQVDFYEKYLVRLFSQLLPMEEISLTHAPDLQAAVLALAKESWDVILMDFTLGPRFNFFGQIMRNGADLVAFRRAVEERSEGAMPRAQIWGIAANQASNYLLAEAGAGNLFSKLEVEAMAKSLAAAMKNSRPSQEKAHE